MRFGALLFIINTPMEKTDKILMLESDKGFGTLLQEMFAKNGFAVDLCLDEETALSYCQHALYNLYISSEVNFIAIRGPVKT